MGVLHVYRELLLVQKYCTFHKICYCQEVERHAGLSCFAPAAHHCSLSHLRRAPPFPTGSYPLISLIRPRSWTCPAGRPKLMPCE